MIVYDHTIETPKWRFWIRTTTNHKLKEYELENGWGKVNGHYVLVRIPKVFAPAERAVKELVEGPKGTDSKLWNQFRYRTVCLE